MKSEITTRLDLFFSQAKKVNYKKGEIILRAGDPIFGIFYLKKGFVRQYLISEEGEEVTINIFRPGSFFPIMLVMVDTSNRYFFEAMSAIETYRENPDLVMRFVKEQPDVLLDLTTRFAQAVIGLSKRIETLAIGSVYAKVVSLLFYLANKFGEEHGSETVINLPVTHQDLANWTGAKRETVSRQLEKLIEEGIISQEKHFIIIKDIARLEGELNQYHHVDD